MLLPPYIRAWWRHRFGPRWSTGSPRRAGYTPGCATALLGANGRRMLQGGQQARAAAVRGGLRRRGRPAARAALRTSCPRPALDPRGRPVGAARPGARRAPTRPAVEPGRARPLPGHAGGARAVPDAAAGLVLATYADVLADEARCWAARAPHGARLAAPRRGRGARRPGPDRHRGQHPGRTPTPATTTSCSPPTAGRCSCDWNWPTRGRLDRHRPRGHRSVRHGLDVDRVLAERSLTRHVAADDIDALLALLAGFFLERRDAPVPNSSPNLRRHQAWFAQATWSWPAGVVAGEPTIWVVRTAAEIASGRVSGGHPRVRPPT